MQTSLSLVCGFHYEGSSIQKQLESLRGGDAPKQESQQPVKQTPKANVVEDESEELPF